ncbi:hypothetical protein AZ09_10290 [Acetobacter aceti 1023]|nr:hypothetical protein AZ09_10290 [Acetobacter aceti 1023]
MDRLITYSGQIPLDTDILRVGRYAKIGVGNLAMQLYGANSAAWGFGVTRSTSAMSLTIAPGFILSVAPVDAAAIGGNGGGLPADVGTTENQYYSTSNTVITIPAAGTVYTVYGHCYEQDTDDTVLPFYNASNPSQTQAGPNNLGNSLPTVRSGVVDLIVALEEPSVDIGFVLPLFTVSVPTGSTNTNSAIISYAELFYPAIPQLERGRYLGTQKFTSSGTYTPSNRARMARVRMCGAGGPGGFAQANSDTTHVSAGGSGGAGGEIEFWFDVSDGAAQSITVGASAESTNTNIQSTSGSSWFGAAVECQGGNEGGYGITTSDASLSIGVQAGGGPTYIHDNTKVLSVVYQKQGQGGSGGWAINGTVYPGIGTPSGWGSGTYTTDNGPGTAASGFGAGGAGGGSNTTTGYAGGLGSAGIVIIEEYA